MNKKRFISLAMALVMIVGVLAMAMVTASADATTFDYRTAFIGERNGYYANGSSIEVNGFATPNVTDGTIGESEYSATRTSKAAAKMSGPFADVAQYLAHDANWVYLAFDIPDYKADVKFDIYLYPLQVFDNASASFMDYETVRFVFAPNGTEMVFNKLGNPSPDLTTHATAATFETDATTFSGKLTTKTVEGKTGAVVEAKFSKAVLAAAAGVSVEDFTNFRFMAKYNTSENKTLYLSWPVLDGTIRAALCGSTNCLSTTTTPTDGWLINNNTSLWAISVNLNDAPAATEGSTAAATTATPETNAPTTKAPTTAAATTATPATKAPETTAEEAKKGCGGSLTVSALALLPIIAGGVVIARKRED